MPHVFENVRINYHLNLKPISVSVFIVLLCNIVVHEVLVNLLVPVGYKNTTIDTKYKDEGFFLGTF